MVRGAEMTYRGGVGVNTGDFFGLPAVAIGLVRHRGEDIKHIKRFEPERELYQSIVLRDNRIIGYLCVGNVTGAGLFHHLIRQAVEVTPELTADLVRKGARFPVLMRHLPATAHTLFQSGRE
jgi:NAD(P)H-nitrite reductase large subunit